MKRIQTIITALALVFMATAAMAQKPASGNFVIEGQVNSIFNDDNIGISNGENGPVFGLRGRYFISDDVALRGTLGISTETQNTNVDGNDGKNTFSSLGLAFGIEKHFGGTGRLSPYIGGDVFFNTTASKYEINDAGTADAFDRTEIKNFGNDATSFGLRGVLGADYYFVDNVFLGVEFGLGFQLDSDKDLEETFGDGSSTTTDAPDATFSFSTAQVNPTAGLRIGFVLN